MVVLERRQLCWQRGESVVYADAGYQEIEKRSEMEGRGIEKTNPHTRAKGKNQFRLIKRQFGFQQTIMRGMLGIHCKVCAGNPLQPDHDSL